jgi:hypothetical protein
LSGSGAGQAPRAISRLQLLLVAAAILAFAGAVASAVVDAASGQAGVQFRSDSGDEPFVTATTIAGDPQESHDYTSRGRSGDEGSVETHAGTALVNVVADAGLTEGDFGYLTFPTPKGGTLYISSDDVFHPAFPEGPILVGVDGGEIRLFRPVRNVDTGTSKNLKRARLVGLLNQGNVLSIKISPTEKSVKDRTNVFFSSKVTGQEPGEKVRLTWDFGDGDESIPQSRADISHYFHKPGTFFVTATAEGNKGSGGVSDEAKIVVGKAPDGPGSNGDNPGGHHGNGDPQGTGHTQATGGGVPDGSNSGTGDEGTTTDPYTPSYATPYDTSPYYPTTPTTPTPGAPDTPSPAGTTPNPVDTTPVLPPGVENVEGTLISDVSDISAPTAASAAASQEASRVQSSPTSVDLDQNKSKTSTRTLSLSAAGVLLLFFAGIGREMRLPRHDLA